MNPTHESRLHVRSRFRSLCVSTSILALAFATSPAGLARPVPGNLGGGLDRLARAGGFSTTRSLTPEQRAALQGGGGDAATVELARQDPFIRDGKDRVLVKITLDGSTKLQNVAASLATLGDTEVTATDATYRAGVIEAYVHPSRLAELATTVGVLAVVPSSRAVYEVGTATSQGVIQHRVNRIPANITGAGITVGVLSDSYNTNGGPITAEDDIASGDLPGPGNPFGNTEPVVVLEDDPGGSDEGRAMLQIVHDLAPGARLGFATANTGEVGFANNIRSLAGLPGSPNAVDGFNADVIIDDVIYLAEPFFQDGVIAQAVDDVADAGVAYFSSAGNRPATQGYDAKLDLVPAVGESLEGTNLDFSFVDPALYAGGFHNFAGPGGLDIAQDVALGANSVFVFQWNEPYDPIPPTIVDTITYGFGVTPDPATGDEYDFFTFEGTAGQLVAIYVDGDDTLAPANPDVTIALLDSNFNLIEFRDATTNPELLIIELPADDTYFVLVGGYEDAFGGYYYEVDEVEITERVLSDFNVLLFFPDGSYAGALAEQNLFTNRPLEIAGFGGALNLQMVFARGNTPNPASKPANHLRYVVFGSGGPQEYFSYLASMTYGHNCARGANSVAAYAFYPPFIPESFSSPGHATIYFDKDSNRLRFPDIRLKPDIAAMDGANTTFFFSDASQDDDDLPNFFGTSASAPHAGAIAALMLDAAGGPGSLPPWKVSVILKSSTFPHDLDPFTASGLARTRRGGLVGVVANADPNSISQFDPNVFTVFNWGIQPVAGITFDLSGGNTTQSPAGLVFDERGEPVASPPGQPFILGSLQGLAPEDVTSELSNPADAPGVAGQWKELSLKFARRSFGWGDSLAFGIDRDEADSAGPNAAVGGNSADLLGAGVDIPSGRITRGGATFSGRLENGEKFDGTFFNWIGTGYSRLDGFGFVDAQEAVRQAAKHRKPHKKR